MFEEIIVATAKAQAAQAAAQLNKLNEDIYVQACKNWAAEKTRLVDGPRPQVPYKFEGVYDQVTNGFTLVPTPTPVTTVKPEDFLATSFETDTNGVGGPVGKALDQPGLFAIMSNAWPYAGQIYTHTDGRVFVCQQPTPWQKYWLQVK